MRIAALVVLLAVFLALAGVALGGSVPPADSWLRELILAHVPRSFVAVFGWINLAGSWRVLVPGTVLLLLFRRARSCWWVWVLLMVTAPLLEGALKGLIGRPRPEGTAFGFPSGHATAAAAYFGALVYAAGDLPPAVRRPVRAGAVSMIALVALARIILRAHWPSDVLGGIALGLACFVTAALISSSTGRSPSGSRSPEPPARDASSRTPPGRG